MVSGEAFCNREQETADLVRAMESARKLFVFSERRCGKTSLVRAALDKLSRKGYLSAYVDLWPTDSEATFATAVAKAITESMSTSVKKLLETAKRFFGSLSPSVTVEEILPALSAKLAAEFGSRFPGKSLRRMAQFADAFPDEKILSTLSRELGWSHFVELIPLKSLCSASSTPRCATWSAGVFAPCARRSARCSTPGPEAGEVRPGGPWADGVLSALAEEARGAARRRLAPGTDSLRREIG